MKIHVLLADDHELFRDGIRKLLSAEPDLVVAGEAADAAACVRQAAELHPDIVLLAIGMPGLGSFEAARRIRHDRPKTKILFLSVHDDEHYLAKCMSAGGSGYVLKDAPAAHLLAAIRNAYGGRTYLCPRTRVTSAPRQRIRALTPREREIHKSLGEGCSVKKIAAQLNLSDKTVEGHKSSLMRKLQRSSGPTAWGP